MLRRITAAAGTLGFLALSVTAQANPTAPEIFKPVQNDLALVNLRKLLGCVVDGVWTAAACSDTRPLTVALGYFNVACLIVATILACYLLYSLVADTANDGQPFGRATNSRYTLLRVLAGAILALPISSGLSLVQILVVQIAVWGTGFGDTLWSKVAGTQLTGMYGTLSTPQPYEGDFVLRGKLASAMEGRLYGHVCARALQEYAANVSGNPAAASIQSATATDSGSWGSSNARSITHYFNDLNGYFRSSNNLCGGVTFKYVTVNPNPTDSNDATITSTLISLAEQRSQQAFQTAIASLDASAAAIAQSIVSGTRNDVAIKQQIKAAIDSAYMSANQSVTQTNNAQLLAALQNYLSNSTQNGWLSAALWQRSLTAVQSKLHISSAALAGTLTVVPPADLTSYIPLLHRFSSAYAPLVDKAQRDLAYVVSFNGYFTAQGMANVASITSDDAAKEFDSGGCIGPVVSLIYSRIFQITSRPETTTWKDPILEAQEIGHTIAYYSLGAAGAGAAVNYLKSWIEPNKDSWDVTKATYAAAGPFSTFLYFVSALLIAAAFLLIGVVPFVILVHFLLAAFNWFLVIAEAMVAVPIWLLTKFMPARSDSLIGNSGQGYMFFLGILLRPALIVIGLLLSLLLMRVGIDITNLFFKGALAMLSPDGSIAGAMLGAAGIFAYALMMFLIITMSASQISSLPETVLGWLGGQIARRSAASAASTAVGVMLPTNPARLGQGATARTMAKLTADKRPQTQVQDLRNPPSPKKA